MAPSVAKRLGWSRFLDPHVEDRLILEEDEVIREMIMRHWVTRIWPGTQVLAGMAVLGSVPLMGHFWWFAMLISVLLGLRGFWQIHVEFMDRFVVTNLRVFRVHGVFDQKVATMPLSRVLDITMHRPALGQMFQYATFVFESAAQDQGQREIRFVGYPDQRLHDFTRLVMSAGLTGRAKIRDIADGG